MAMDIHSAGALVPAADHEAIVRCGFWSKIRRTLGKVPFTADALAAYYCALDPRTPVHVKGVLMAALAYFVMPVDLVPDVVVGLGYTDDAAVLLAAMQMLSPHIREEHHDRAHGYLNR
ncbi:MAG: DUF1232 domain-containing protein [Rhodospirillales bacterium]|nr:MAG: DUF1232 domain-containing protein [Rhodospirillales bacterium]